MILVGKMLYGYCNGYFGRNSYGEKRIEAVGADWVVVRGQLSGDPNFATFPDTKTMLELITKWGVEGNDS